MGNSEVNKLYEELIERFSRWAQGRSDIRAAVIVGSRARFENPADEWADLDIIIVTTSPDYYISTTDWVSNIGNSLLTFVEPTATGDQSERRVLYEGMLDVDFSIIPQEVAMKLLQAEVTPRVAAQVSDAFARGMRVLLDKDGRLSELQKLIASSKTAPPSPPGQHEFLEVVNDFLYHAVWTAKHLQRGEIWWANGGVNCHLSGLMLRMMEWHAHVTHGWEYDTWFRGRFLEKWADSKVLNELRLTQARYDMKDTEQSLLAAIDLFSRLAEETAGGLNYPYPKEVDNRVTIWVKACLGQQVRNEKS